ncbi:helix-turn-helix domain-containing protein (plasmid) [Aeromonas dhakensis]|uniref:winged helix-turn-helix domain-containing protein n=1 Tax=Aeromonas dhakensis TaxID=196024 RepID=UPI0021B27B84|nr:helix-turn-helix domain-containing protein [Aeromonas dhakensis]UXB09967.1 helix-turn-helix domain-containing protein [Aeromonas dhakensis]
MKKILINNACFHPLNRTFVTISAEEGEQKFKLSEAESKILEFLLENHGEYFSKEHLVSIGWGGRPVSSNSLPVAIANIRKLPSGELFSINNLTKVGYVLTKNEGVFISILPTPPIVDEIKSCNLKNAVEPKQVSKISILRNKFGDLDGKKKLRYTQRLVTSAILFLGSTSSLIFIYFYTDWIDITCRVNESKGYCYTALPPDKIKWKEENNNFQLFAKSGELEELIILNKRQE